MDIDSVVLFSDFGFSYTDFVVFCDLDFSFVTQNVALLELWVTRSTHTEACCYNFASRVANYLVYLAEN